MSFFDGLGNLTLLIGRSVRRHGDGIGEGNQAMVNTLLDIVVKASKGQVLRYPGSSAIVFIGALLLTPAVLLGKATDLDRIVHRREIFAFVILGDIGKEDLGIVFAGDGSFNAEPLVLGQLFVNCLNCHETAISCDQFIGITLGDTLDYDCLKLAVLLNGGG